MTIPTINPVQQEKREEKLSEENFAEKQLNQKLQNWISKRKGKISKIRNFRKSKESLPMNRKKWKTEKHRPSEVYNLVNSLSKKELKILEKGIKLKGAKKKKKIKKGLRS
jgi:hypothetical protein